MQEKEIAEFTVHITSVKDATWQGTVAAGDEVFHFQSAMEFLRWLWKWNCKRKEECTGCGSDH